MRRRDARRCELRTCAQHWWTALATAWASKGTRTSHCLCELSNCFACVNYKMLHLSIVGIIIPKKERRACANIVSANFFSASSCVKQRLLQPSGHHLCFSVLQRVRIEP
jgi:hypothetical protein